MGRLDDIKKRLKTNNSGEEDSSMSRLERIKKQVNGQKTPASTGSVPTDIEDLMNEYTTFINDSKSSYESLTYGNAGTTATSINERSDALRKKIEDLKVKYNLNRSNLTDQEKELNIYLNKMKWSTSDANKAIWDAYDGFKQYKTEEDYQAAVKSAEEQEKLKTLDIDAYQKEIDGLKYELENYKPSTWSELANGNRTKELETQISEMEAYLNRAKRTQEGIKLSGVADPNSKYYDPDFNNYTGYKSTKMGDDDWWDKLRADYGLTYDDLTYEYINGADNGMRSEILRKVSVYNSDNASADSDKWKIYNHMTTDEIAIYNYYYAKNGKEKAEEYLDSIRESLNVREASRMFGNLEGNTGLEMLFGAYAGLEQFESGVKNLFADGYTPASATQMVSGMVREDLEDSGFKIFGSSLGQIGYDAITTTSNMLPSILVGATMPGGQILGTGLLGTSAAGHAKVEMLNLGYSKAQANAYAALVGGSEALLQYAIGGITKLGGKAPQGITNMILSKVDNAFARTAIQIGGNMLSEGFEEGLQTVLEPWFKSVVTGLDFEAPNIDEVLYSSLLGALTAGILEGGGTVASERGIYNQGKSLINQGIDVNKLAELGKDTNFVSADSVAYRLAGKVNESTGAYTIARLFNEMNAQLTTQNQNDIIRSLERKGVTPKHAETMATALANVVAGVEITKKQAKMLDSNPVVAKTMKDVILNENSTVRQRMTKFDESVFPKSTETAPVTAQETTGQAETTVPTENTSTVQSAENKAENVSDDGKTKQISTGEEISIKRIASTKNGLSVELDNGSVIKASDISYSTEGEAIMFDMLSRMETSPEVANEIFNSFKPTDLKQAMNYFVNIPLAYSYGKIGYKQGLNNVNMSKEESYRAYNQGRRYAEAKAVADTKTSSHTDTKTDDKTEKGGIVYENGFTYDESKATKIQKVSMAHIDVIRQMTNLEVHVFESIVKDGKRVAFIDGKWQPAPNGFFRNGNQIYIDINAGNKGEGAMLNTMGHEVAHYIRRWNAKGFKQLADFLFKHYGHNGVSVDALIEAQKQKIIKRYKFEGKELPSEAKLYDMAYEEVVADAMSDMLADPKAYEKLAQLKSENRTLWQKIGEAIKSVLDKLKSALGIYKDTPTPWEAQHVRDFAPEVYEKLQDLYIKAFVEADANYEATIGSRNLEDFSEAVNENGEALFQYRAMEADEDTYREMLKKWGKMTDSQINNLFDTIDKAMELIKANLEALDYAWEQDIDDRGFLPVKPNSDKLYQVSLDFSTLCRKRILQQTIQVQLQEALNKTLSKEEGIAIRDALIAIQEEGRQIEVACALCYVESARMKSPKQIQKFLNDRESIIKEFFAGKSGGSIKDKVKQAEANARERLHKENPNGILGKDGVTMLDPRTASLNALPKKYADQIREAKKEAKKSYVPTAEEQKLIDVANKMTISDFTSPEGLENLAKNYPRLFDTYTSFVRNATHAKGIENDTWWRAGDSMQIGDVLIANMNKENGLRSQSWSDFQVIHILDYIASTIELATRNTKEQAYSKVPDYVELMGSTGVMINMSLIPTAKFNGALDYDSVEGMDYERALQLRDKYHATAGTICIGVDNGQIKLLLGDATIDYVIPYHKSAMSATVRKLMRIPTWTDYESYQSEGKLSRAEAEKQAKKHGVKLLDSKDSNYQKGTTFSEWFDLKEAQQIAKMENANPTDKAKQKKYGVMYGGYMAMQNAANNYLKLCAERGLAPKFSHEKADFTTEENYWKLLIDRKMVDNVTGEIIEQQNIKPVFNGGEVMRILNDEVERYPKVKADQDYAIRKVTEKMLSGEVKGGMSAKAIADVMKKPVDNVTNVNILASAEDMKLSDRDSWNNIKSIQGLESYSVDEVIDITKTHIQSVLEEYGEYAEIIAVRPLGSRAKGTAKADSDLDIVVQYEGDIREDDMFNMLNDEDSKLYIEGIEVDINPIRADESGDIEDYFGRVYDFDKYSTKYSDRDSLGNELSQEQQEFFKDSKVRDKKGNLKVVYHGTKANFNVFAKGDIGFHFGTKGAARGRVGTGKNVTIKEVYLNITNPIVFDEDLGSWDADYRLTQELFERGILTRDEAEQVLLSDDKTYRRPTEKANKKLREMLLQKGYDGIEYRNTFESKKDSTSYIAFNSNQVKEIANQKPTPSADIRYSDRDSYAPTFYSYMGKVVDGIKSEKIGAGGVVSYLKGKGVKNEEIKWSGIETWLEGKKSVTKKELQEFIAGSQLQIGEQMVADEKNAEIDLVPREGGNKLALYIDGQLEDTFKKNEFGQWESEAFGDLFFDKQEILDQVKSDYARNVANTKWGQYKLDGGENYRELVFTMPKSSYSNNAMRGHWGYDAEGILVHARVQDFTVDGKKMLFIEELQSDWHNEGHSKGYSTKEYEEAVESHDKLYNEYKKMDLAFHKYVRSNDFMTDPEDVRKKKHDWLRGKAETAQKKYLDAEKVVNSLKEKGAGDTPDAPFKDTYHEYVLKRLLRMAAEEGYDSIGWTPADIQSDRWSDQYAEGYRIEYDQDMPKFLNKYGKKWGAKVGKSTISSDAQISSKIAKLEADLRKKEHDLEKADVDFVREVLEEGITEIKDKIRKLQKGLGGIEVWSMDITDSMKDSVLYEGQTLYSEREDLSQIRKELNSKYNIDPRRVSILADSYMENYGGVLKKAQFHLPFFTITRDLAEASVTGNAEVLERADREIKELADEIVGSPKIKGEVIDTISAIKKHLKGVRIKIPKFNKGDFDAIGGFENFRKKHMGKLLLANNGLAIDTLYPELQELFGTGYFPNEITNVADQLMKIAEVIDTPIKSEINYDVDEAREYMVGELYDKISKIVFNEKDSKYINYRDTELVSNRTLLANALESVAQNEIEANKLKQYKEKIDLIEREQSKLTAVKAEANKLRFTKGRTPDETKRMKELDAEATMIANRIHTYDRQLLNLESTTALKNVLQREKKMAYKKAEQRGKEAIQRQRDRAAQTIQKIMSRNQESRKKAMESRHKTEMRHKIKSVVSDLNKLLLNPTKEQHVPIGLQKVVAEALDAINMDTMNAEERVAYYNDLISKSSDPDKIAELTKKRDFFEYRDMNFKDRISALKNAYAEFKESEDPLIRNAHNDAIEDLIKNTVDSVGNKTLKDMSYEQLESVYNMYRAVLATVRNANQMFLAGRRATVSANSEAVKTEVEKAGGHKDRVLKLTKWLKQFGWTMLKPVTAMKVIGSETLAKLFDNIRAGEDKWAVNVSEAKDFYQDKANKYNYKKWDFKKQYHFTDNAGNGFSLNLEQIMSLYAYSKRAQADKHLEFGGFIFDESIEITEKKLGIPLKYEVNDANPYRIDRAMVQRISASLSTEQRAFVDEMQAYLSDVMGAKGNEISLAMYDIKLYNEKNYFPLKTSRYFREFDSEKSATPKIKNSGFSKKTVPQAGNPIVLSNFMDVWASHVNDMSMYHAFVLPLEDFMRVYNYSSIAGGYDSVQQYIKNAYGSQANQYIEKLMVDLNGGARVDSTAGVINKGLSLFKKASVFASASVVIQQPSAIARALAYINPKYFVTSAPSAINLIKHKSVWAEMKKYAPVAVIKEMGYFDTGMGKSTVDWIKGNKTIKDKLDDALSKAPALADELSWSYIWEAIKRETKATTKLTVGSEEFLKKCGERFTEVITNTQVYDSVLSRSGMMRSKDTGMKMATAFMAEPTTTLNMMVDGFVQGKRGNKKFTASTVGAVSASIILNAILVSLVYASRDDDEDETYAEKYIGSLVSELLDGFNPLTYIPFVKDMWSIAQGYDVERSDMSVISDLWKTVEGLFGTDKSGWEKVTDMTGAVASLFGLPLKNILRDAKGMYNLAKTITSGTPTTGAGIADSIEDAFKNSVPLWGRFNESESKSDKLYDAILSGDQSQIDRIKSQFKDEKAIESAMKQALRENDSRIKEAAQARFDGDISGYTRIAKEIIAEGHFSQDTVVGAINAEMSAIKNAQPSEPNTNEEEKDEVTSIYSTSDINSAFESGDNAVALEIIQDLINTKVANGKEEKEAKSSLRSSMTSYWKPLYKEAYQKGDTSEMYRIRQILLASGLYGNTDNVVETAKGWLK